MTASPLETALIAAVVSFLLSGLFVTIFKDWLERARNQVLIQSLELAPSGEVIEVPRELIKLSENSGWMPSLRKAETYQSLARSCSRARAISTRLEVGRILVEEWLSKAESYAGDTFPDQLYQECPYFLDEVIGSMIQGAIRRQEIGSPPVELGSLQRASTSKDILWSARESRWLLQLRGKFILFPLEMSANDREKVATETLAYSFATRSVPNMLFYLRQFNQASRKDALDTTDIVSRIEDLLLPASRLCIRASVVNTGAKAAVIRPFATARLVGLPDGDLKEILTLSEARKPVVARPTANDVLRSFRNEPDDDDGGLSISIGEFVPSDRQAYVLVPPKAMLDIVLISIEPFGMRGDRLRTLYASEIVRCSILVEDLSGNKIESSLVPFARTVTAPEKKRLLET